VGARAGPVLIIYLSSISQVNQEIFRCTGAHFTTNGLSPPRPDFNPTSVRYGTTPLMFPLSAAFAVKQHQSGSENRGEGKAVVCVLDEPVRNRSKKKARRHSHGEARPLMQVKQKRRNSVSNELSGGGAKILRSRRFSQHIIIFNPTNRITFFEPNTSNLEGRQGQTWYFAPHRAEFCQKIESRARPWPPHFPLGNHNQFRSKLLLFFFSFFFFSFFSLSLAGIYTVQNRRRQVRCWLPPKAGGGWKKKTRRFACQSIPTNPSYPAHIPEGPQVFFFLPFFSLLPSPPSLSSFFLPFFLSSFLPLSLFFLLLLQKNRFFFLFFSPFFFFFFFFLSFFPFSFFLPFVSPFSSFFFSATRKDTVGFLY